MRVAHIKWLMKGLYKCQAFSTHSMQANIKGCFLLQSFSVGLSSLVEVVIGPGSQLNHPSCQTLLSSCPFTQSTYPSPFHRTQFKICGKIFVSTLASEREKGILPIQPPGGAIICLLNSSISKLGNGWLSLKSKGRSLRIKDSMGELLTLIFSLFFFQSQ